MSPRLGENPELVRAELRDVLASAPFARSKRSSELLRYLVEQVLEGRAENLKEYVLAVEVFGRDESFDPRIETLVRVEANRLRSRLKAYYEGPGAHSPLHIDVPVGGYVPVFTRIPAESEEAPVARRRWRPWYFAAAVVLPPLAWFAGARLPHHERVEVRRLSRLTQADSFYAHPALAPDGTSIVYASDRGGQGFLHLWKQSLPAGQPVQLTSGDCNDVTPAIGPDSAWIAFRSTCGKEGVYLIPGGGGPRRLVAYFGRDPSFSPDNRSLIYWVRDPRTRFGKVFAARVDIPAEPVHIAREFDDAHTPAWTPDGKHVLLCGTRRTGGGDDEEHDFWIVPADGGAAVKTEAFSRFARLGLDPHPGALPGLPFAWLGNQVVFPARSRDSVSLWRMPVSKEWSSQADLSPLLASTSYQLHPTIAGATLALTHADLTPRVWSVPLDAQRPRASGPPAAVTQGEGLAPSVSADGRTVVFLVPNGVNQFRVRKKAPIDAPEEELPRLAGPTTRVRISPDGKTAYYRVLEGEGRLKKQVIYAGVLASGETRRVCDNCGAPTDITPDGKLLIYEAPNTVTRLGALRIATGEKWEFAEHSNHALGEARVSADGRRIAFVRDREPDGRHVVAAPFRDGATIPETEWVSITEPTEHAQDPSWSPDGRYLYFLSDRDGWRCVWAQALAPATGRPQGSPVAVQHFHSSRLNPFTFDDRPRHYIGFSVTRNHLFLSLLETKSSVWLGDLQAK